MIRVRRPSLGLLLPAAIASAAGCTSARIQIDPALAASAPEQPIAGMALAQMKRPVTFAGYTATLTRGGGETTTTMRAGPYSREKTTQAYAFAMTGGTPPAWSGACTFGTLKQSALFPVQDDAGLVCELQPEGAAAWRLQLASQGKLYGPNSLSGTLGDGATELGVAMVHRLAGSSFASASPVGYELRDGSGAAVAAVQTFSPYLVWIDPRLPAEQQTAVAAGISALLLSGGATSRLNADK
jgi:hypothetical protein